MRTFESVGQYHDHWSWLLLSAPDRFRSYKKVPEPIDQVQALKEAFESLRTGFHFAERKVKDQRLIRIAREMIEMSLEAYLAGDSKKGAHVLQECEGLIWTKKSLRIKHAVEAERRAFGEVVLYKDVKVTPFPFEGTSANLASEQKRLFELADRESRRHVQVTQALGSFCWVCTTDGRVVRVSAEPRADATSVASKPQKSWRACYNELKRLAATGEISSGILGEVGGGMITFAIEQRGKPRIRAVCLYSLNASGVPEYKATRFHLEDPHMFDENVAVVQQTVPGNAPASRERP